MLIKAAHAKAATGKGGTKSDTIRIK